MNSDEKGHAQGGALVAMLFNLAFLVWESWRSPELDCPRTRLGYGVETCQGAPSCVPVHSSEKAGGGGGGEELDHMHLSHKRVSVSSSISLMRLCSPVGAL